MSPTRPRPAVAAAALLLLLGGCQTPRARQEEPPPFVFRSLDLKAQDGQGRPSWTLRAPEARYDLRRRLARAEAPQGLIYRAGKPLYRLQAASGTVLNDGEVILLEGGVRLERLGAQPLLLLTQRARWLPRRQRLQLDRPSQAFDRQRRLMARKAEFRFDLDQLSLQGAPQLELWTQPFDPLRQRPSAPAALRLAVPSATWQPGNGRLLAPGPVLGWGRGRKDRAGAMSLRLEAEGLEGNTAQQLLELKGAVRVDDPSGQQSFRGRDLSLDASGRRAVSDQPFLAQRDNLVLEGARLRVDGVSQTVVVEGSCRIQRPGEQIRAERCAWNWQSEQLQAGGAPGDRVVSHFRLRQPPR